MWNDGIGYLLGILPSKLGGCAEVKIHFGHIQAKIEQIPQKSDRSLMLAIPCTGVISSNWAK